MLDLLTLTAACGLQGDLEKMRAARTEEAFEAPQDQPESEWIGIVKLGQSVPLFSKARMMYCLSWSGKLDRPAVSSQRGQISAC